MPIAKRFREFYQPAVWNPIRERILARAGNKCECCGKPNRTRVFTYTWKSRFLVRDAIRTGHHMMWVLGAGACWHTNEGRDVMPWAAKGLPRRAWVKLTVGHLDHDPSNNADSNLRAMCGWCHLHYDRLHHKESRSVRKDAGRPVLQTGEAVA